MKPMHMTGLLAAFASMALGVGHAAAQTPVSYAAGDLLLGFRASGGAGVSKDYVVNIGPVSQFTGASSSFVVAGLGDIAADLTALYGANWSSRADVFWSVSGSPSNLSQVGADDPKTLYATKRQDTPGAINAAGWLRQSSANQGPASSKMLGMAQAYAKTAGVANISTAHSDKAVVQNVSDVNSYASYQPGGTVTNAGPSPGISYAYFNPTIEGSVANGGSGAVLELYRLVPGTADTPGQLVGLFTIDNSGALAFFPASYTGTGNVSGGNATVQFQSPSYSVSESGGQLTAKVVRGGNLSNAFTVNFSTADGSAASGADFTGAGSQSISFAANQTEATVTVPITNRPGPQGNRSFSLALSGASSGASVVTPSVPVTITEPGGTISFTSATFTSAPTSGGVPTSAVLTLTRQDSAGGSVSVDVSKTGGSILASELDFTNPTTVTFTNGQTSGSVSVPLKTIPATASRTIVLDLGNAQGGAVIGSPSSAIVTITTRDTKAPAIALTNPPSGTLAAPGTFSVSGTVLEDKDLSQFKVALNGAVLPVSIGSFTPNTPVSFNVGTLQAENGPNTLSVQAVDASGNVTTITKSFSYVNPTAFVTQAGTYTGLIVPAGAASNDNSGSITLVVTSTGAFTGKVSLSGADIKLKGVFGNDGTARFFPTLSSALSLVDVSDFRAFLGALSVQISGGQVTGAVKTQATDGTTLAALDMGRAFYSAANPVSSHFLNASSKGVYAVALPSKAQAGNPALSTYPQGDGAASLYVLPTGSVQVKGYLADGSVVAMTGTLRQDNSVALFGKLYRGLGSIAGKAALNDSATDSDVAGTDLLWVRPARTRAQYYPAGWPTGIRVDLLGTKATAPASLNFGQGASDLVNGNATLVFSEGLLSQMVTNAVNVDPSTGKVALIPDKTTKYALKLASGTGLFSGTFTHTDSTVAPFRGAVLTKGVNKGGFGYFLSAAPEVFGASGESGAVNLNP